jgi:hypothetical protein
MGGGFVLLRRVQRSPYTESATDREFVFLCPIASGAAGPTSRDRIADLNAAVAAKPATQMHRARRDRMALP